MICFSVREKRHCVIRIYIFLMVEMFYSFERCFTLFDLPFYSFTSVEVNRSANSIQCLYKDCCLWFHSDTHTHAPALTKIQFSQDSFDNDRWILNDNVLLTKIQSSQGSFDNDRQILNDNVLLTKIQFSQGSFDSDRQILKDNALLTKIQFSQGSFDSDRQILKDNVLLTKTQFFQGGCDNDRWILKDNVFSTKMILKINRYW